MGMTEKERRFLLKSQQGEMNAVLAYKALADKVKIKRVDKTSFETQEDDGFHLDTTLYHHRT